MKPKGEAPRGQVRSGNWSSGLKQYFGTSYEAYDSSNGYSASSPTAPLSKVWFTGAHNIPTEIHWPTIDRPQVRDSQILVTDGRSFLFQEKGQARSTIRWLKRGVPAFETINQDPANRFRIERLIYTDPSRPVVLQRIRIHRNMPGLRFYLLHNPSVANSPNGDMARVSLEAPGRPQAMYAWQGNEYQALLTTIPWKQVSAGFEGINDGFQDLTDDYVLDSYFERASDGNVVTTAWLEIPETLGVTEFVWALGFGSTEAESYRLARESMLGASAALDLYTSQWESYQRSLRDLSDASRDGGELYRASVAMIKSMEDKTRAGAFIASPSKPWGQHIQDRGPIGRRIRSFSERADAFGSLGLGRALLGPRTLAARTEEYGDDKHGLYGGYHLVWPRDLYQMATSFLAIGDPKSAVASLDYLKLTQLNRASGDWNYGFRRRSKDGSYHQNSWIDGQVYWGGLQMDQVAVPVILAHRLWRAGHIRLEPYWDMVRRAADFIAEFGPWSAQERWEEQMGVSPSTVAAQISAMWLGGGLAEVMGDRARARRYWDTGDAWSFKPNDNLEAWSFTTTGGLGNGKYYVRVEATVKPDQTWDPDDEVRYQQSNGGNWVREKDVIDGGFLELVRFGVRSARDYHVMETLHEYDRYLRVKTSRGEGYFRYNGDRYNYDDTTYKQTKGMLWPFLTGERAAFELAYRLEAGADPASARASLQPYVESMEGFATPSKMLPEQVWDAGAYQGQPTGAATPLGWTHGEYVKLLASCKDARADVIPEVRARARRSEGGGR